MNEASSVSDGEFRFRGSAGDLKQWAMLQPTIGGCAFCPEWKVTGTASEVHQLSIAHRQEVHPDLSTKRTRRRGKGIPMRWRTTLDEEASAEIADTRSKRMKLLGIPETEAAP